MSQHPSSPPTIPRSAIIFGDRARTEYDGIEALAEDILEQGLIQPIVLKPLEDGKYLLMAGGRRTRAIEAAGIESLTFGISSEPGQAGYVLVNAATVKDKADEQLVELVENLHRRNLDWRDELKLLVPAYKQKRREQALAGKSLRNFSAIFGKMVGNYSHTDINAAEKIYDRFLAEPEFFSKCVSITDAYEFMLKETAAFLEKQLLAVTMKPKAPETSTPSPESSSAPVDPEAPVIPHFDLSSRYQLGSSLDFLRTTDRVFSHIITDPDYALDMDTLDAHPNNKSGSVAPGVAQASAADSLTELFDLIRLAFDRVTGFFTFFTVPQHMNKVQDYARSIGWRVQSWPIIWQKTGPSGWANTAPHHNFPSSYEIAIVCRKPAATLASPQKSSLILAPNEDVRRALAHPFAKPDSVWNFFYSAICKPGDTVYDPFVGRGSSAVSAVRHGIDHYGHEINPEHHRGCILNVQAELTKIHGTCTFE